MSKFEMPSDDSIEESQYAGKDPVYPNRKVMQTKSGERVVIVDYLKDAGLYMVRNLDKPNELTKTAYSINPDELAEIDQDLIDKLKSKE